MSDRGPFRVVENEHLPPGVIAAIVRAGIDPNSVTITMSPEVVGDEVVVRVSADAFAEGAVVDTRTRDAPPSDGDGAGGGA